MQVCLADGCVGAVSTAESGRGSDWNWASSPGRDFAVWLAMSGHEASRISEGGFRWRDGSSEIELRVLLPAEPASDAADELE